MHARRIITEIINILGLYLKLFDIFVFVKQETEVDVLKFMVAPQSSHVIWALPEFISVLFFYMILLIHSFRQSSWMNFTDPVHEQGANKISSFYSLSKQILHSFFIYLFTYKFVKLTYSFTNLTSGCWMFFYIIIYILIRCEQL